MGVVYQKRLRLASKRRCAPLIALPENGRAAGRTSAETPLGPVTLTAGDTFSRCSINGPPAFSMAMSSRSISPTQAPHRQAEAERGFPHPASSPFGGGARFHAP